MSKEDAGLLVLDAIEKVYKPTLEKKLFKSIISALYIAGIDIGTVESLIYTIYDNLPAHDCEIGEILSMQDSIFAEEQKADGGIESINKLITNEYNKKIALQVVRELKKALFPHGSRKTYRFELGANKWIVMDNQHSEVKYQTFNIVKNQEITDFTRVLLCYPEKVVIHESPIAGVGRTFTIIWRTKDRNYFKTDLMTLPEIEQYLIDHAYVVSPKFLKSSLSAIVQIVIDEELAVVKNEIETPGFYYDTNRNSLKIVGYELKPVDVEGVKKSLMLIEDLSHFFVGSEDKLVTTLKHALVAPFGFAKKQLGQPLELLVPYMYHFGKSGSGKTTIARIGLYFYGQPDSNTNDLGGTEFDTVPRIGEAISKFTFGIVVSEPEGTFESKSCPPLLKTCVERTNARKKFLGNRIHSILALAMVSFASNVPLPNVEGLPRRFVQILYSHNERKTDEEKEAFMKYFKIKNPEECRFNELKPLANYVVNRISADVNLLQYDWKRLANTLIHDAYNLCEMDSPSWIGDWAESVTNEDIDEEETEEIRMFFINEINRETKKIKEYSADTGYPVIDNYTDIVKDAMDFRERVHHVVNNHLLPYMVLHHNNKGGYDEVCFTSGLRKVLTANNIKCYSIPSTAQLLGWKYGNVRINNSQSRCMYVKFDDFLEFLYPEINETDIVDTEDEEYDEEQKLLLSRMQKMRDRDKKLSF